MLGGHRVHLPGLEVEKPASLGVLSSLLAQQRVQDHLRKTGCQQTTVTCSLPTSSGASPHGKSRGPVPTVSTARVGTSQLGEGDGPSSTSSTESVQNKQSVPFSFTLTVKRRSGPGDGAWWGHGSAAERPPEKREDDREGGREGRFSPVGG